MFFGWWFLKPWAVSSHTSADHSLAARSRGTLCRSPEHSLLWYFALKIPGALALLDSQFQLLSSWKGLALFHVSLTSTHQDNLGLFSWLWQRGVTGRRVSSLVKEIIWVSSRMETEKMKIRTITVINLCPQFYDLCCIFSDYSLERIYNVTSSIYVYLLFYIVYQALDFMFFIYIFNVSLYSFSSWNWFWAIYNILLFYDSVCEHIYWSFLEIIT